MVPVFAPAPDLLEALAAAAVIADDVFTRSGLELNYESEKPRRPCSTMGPVPGSYAIVWNMFSMTALYSNLSVA